MMESYRQELIEYWKDKVQYDKDFVDELVTEYTDQMLELHDAIEHRSKSAEITFPALQFANEILDFLDGNGFSCEYGKGSVTLALLEKDEIPLPWDMPTKIEVVTEPLTVNSDVSYKTGVLYLSSTGKMYTFVNDRMTEIVNESII